MPRPTNRLAALALLSVAAGPTLLPAQEPAPTMSAAARVYLASALDTLQRIVLRSDTIAWRRVRDSAFAMAGGAQTPSDTYAALGWALRRANKHSFLQARRPGAVFHVVDDRLGYVRVPSWSGGSASLADSLQTAVRTLDGAGVCGWIVDVRANGGGNMWPMLAGIGPLLGDTLVGAFGSEPDADRWFYKDGVAGILHAGGALDTTSRATAAAARVRDPLAPIAVLFDGATGSSGEAIVLAFRGRPDSRGFGEPTAGFATSNRGASLPDGANMVVTTGYQVDRRGRVAGERIEPDELIVGPPPGWPSSTDVVARAAAAWLAARPACRAAPRAPGR